MILAISQLHKYPINTEPFQWAAYPHFFNEEYLDELIKTFPVENFVLCQSARTDKSYKMFHRTVYDSRVSTSIQAVNLAPVWPKLLTELISSKYIDTLAQLFNIDLANHDIEINFWKYWHGGWLSPHTDKSDKTLSQLFYFNQKWDENWGGSFRILKSDDINDTYTEIFPGIGNSIILVRSDNSWHAVTNQASPENICRCVLQLILWKKT